MLHNTVEEEIPTKSWNKGKLITWLQKRNIDFPEKAMKDEIWTIVSPRRPAKEYHLDKYVKQLGHKILRLPPYHCQFNAIEMVWSECKRKYDSTIIKTKSSPEEIVTTWNDVLQEIDSEKWESYVSHVEKLISDAWSLEERWDASDIQPLIINLGSSSESSDTDSD
jgi:transposase